MTQTQEPQYNVCLEARDQYGLSSLGLMSSYVWQTDPRRLVFVLARYKFVAKMLTGKQYVLEIGCADAFATRIVQQSVGKVCAVDFDPVFIEDAQQRMHPEWQFEVKVHDMLSGTVQNADGVPFDGAYALDVLEHIPESDEDQFIGNITASMSENGVFIAGMPSLESQEYASPPSKAGHVNCKSGEALKATMSRHFKDVFVFSMNDEVVHTGFYPMAHYLLAMGVGKK